MKNIQALLIIFYLLLFTYNINAQNITYYDDEENENVQFQNEYPETINNPVSKVNPSKITYDINIGSSFSTSTYGNSLNLYTAPKINYNFTPKLSISAGVIFINSTINSYYQEEKTNQNQSYLYSSFNYKASERLKISGEILYGMNNSNYNVNNQSKNQDYYVRFNAEYKITKNLTFGIQVANSSNNYYNPFAVPSFNPFYKDPFSDNFSPFAGF